MSPAPPGTCAWRAGFSAFCAAVVGSGLARFAYTPLLPAIIEAHWFDAAEASHLAAANLLGYLAGALLAAPTARRWPAATLMGAMTLASAIILIGCTWPFDVAWFSAWRQVAGIAGGSPSSISSPPRRRQRARRALDPEEAAAERAAHGRWGSQPTR